MDMLLIDSYLRELAVYDLSMDGSAEEVTTLNKLVLLYEAMTDDEQVETVRLSNLQRSKY